MTDSAPPDAAETDAASTAGRRVLALAADLIFASRIRAVGSQGGARVALARSADDLLRQARETPPDLILLDFETRGIDAAGLVASLKSDTATASVPVIAFGRHDNVETIEAVRVAGADRVMARSNFVRVLPGLIAG